MLPSLHDDFLVSYAVNCETRQIKLHVKPDTRGNSRNEDRIARTITFKGVEAYQFENDAFGNIIFSLDAVTVGQILATYGARIEESYRMAGAPGPWAADLASATETLTAKGVKGFILSSSYGLSGWILAKEASVDSI